MPSLQVRRCVSAKLPSPQVIWSLMLFAIPYHINIMCRPSILTGHCGHLNLVTHIHVTQLCVCSRVWLFSLCTTCTVLRLLGVKSEGRQKPSHTTLLYNMYSSPVYGDVWS